MTRGGLSHKTHKSTGARNKTTPSPCPPQKAIITHDASPKKKTKLGKGLPYCVDWNHTSKSPQHRGGKRGAGAYSQVERNGPEWSPTASNIFHRGQTKNIIHCGHQKTTAQNGTNQKKKK